MGARLFDALKREAARQGATLECTQNTYRLRRGDSTIITWDLEAVARIVRPGGAGSRSPCHLAETSSA